MDLKKGDTWSKRILLPEMGSAARHQARPISLAMVRKGRGSRSRRGSTSRKRDTTTQYLKKIVCQSITLQSKKY